MQFEPNMIRVENLTKHYGRHKGVDGLTFSVSRGEIVGFLGPNGAGKTTTIRILSCFISATSGMAIVGGLDVFRDSREIRRMIGYLPENAPLYPEMRVKEYLNFRAGLKDLYGRRRRDRMAEVMTSCGIGDVQRQIIGRLSRGYRQRVGLADCLLNDPELLLLDEPTLGLDPSQTRLVRNLIRGLASRRTVLLCTHILPEVEMTCSRVLIMNKGRIVASDTPERLAALIKGSAVFVAEIQGSSDAVLPRLSAIRSVAQVTAESDGAWNRYTLEGKQGVDIRGDIFDAVVQNGWALRELRSSRRSLEDVFVAVTEEGPK